MRRWSMPRHTPTGHTGQFYRMHLIIRSGCNYIRCTIWDLIGFWDIQPFIKWLGLGIPWHTRGDSWSVVLNVSYHKKHEYIWVSGGDLNGFRDIIHCRFYWIHLIIKKHEFIWFRGGDLNGFCNINHFMKWRGWACLGTPWGTYESVLLNAFYYKKNINIYGLGVGIWTVSEIVCLL